MSAFSIEAPIPIPSPSLPASDIIATGLFAVDAPPGVFGDGPYNPRGVHDNALNQEVAGGNEPRREEAGSERS